MHAEPGKPWRLEELARAAAMSRTRSPSGSGRGGRAAADVPERWRMLLAQRALRDGDTRVGPLAFELGYASESAFSTAFKREVGMSPLRYRSRIRDELSGRPVGTGMTIEGNSTRRFSEATEPVGGCRSDATGAAELYWLTTVRRRRSPACHPAVGIWIDERSCSAPARRSRRPEISSTPATSP